MKALYRKNELGFAIAWIIAYCVLMSIGDSLSEKVGVAKSVTLAISVMLSVSLFVFIKKNNLLVKYGLCKPKIAASKMLFYIPLLLLLTANLCCGLSLNLSTLEVVLYILTMFCVGFLEETIFRGLLFKAMSKNGMKFAVVISSVTFGIGHIIRLFNGSGAELLPNLLQVAYAIAAGFMFVMIFIKSKSLVLCIITHSVFNALSVFSDEATLTMQNRVKSCVFLILVSGSYAIFIALTAKKKN